mmetsp:Transcript_33421/g.92501  ORF Transcript_33421/g.92501 Transcript_33421/m.92501 type:complete len:319 (+) Transcript_33421:148-1104(+)
MLRDLDDFEHTVPDGTFDKGSLHQVAAGQKHRALVRLTRHLEKGVRMEATRAFRNGDPRRRAQHRVFTPRVLSGACRRARVDLRSRVLRSHIQVWQADCWLLPEGCPSLCYDLVEGLAVEVCHLQAMLYHLADNARGGLEPCHRPVLGDCTELGHSNLRIMWHHHIDSLLLGLCLLVPYIHKLALTVHQQVLRVHPPLVILQAVKRRLKLEERDCCDRWFAALTGHTQVIVSAAGTLVQIERDLFITRCRIAVHDETEASDCLTGIHCHLESRIDICTLGAFADVLLRCTMCTLREADAFQKGPPWLLPNQLGLLHHH